MTMTATQPKAGSLVISPAGVVFEVTRSDDDGVYLRSARNVEIGPYTADWLEAHGCELIAAEEKGGV